MTRKIFWEDPYRSRLETHVVAVAGSSVRVAETIFYALSGGQESDRGAIGGRTVVEARKDGLDLVYILEDGSGLAPGDGVVMTIDWDRRYRLMRLHFAAEIILELVYRARPGVPKIGAHIAEDKARIDFEWPENIAKLLPALKEQALALIAADRPIVSAFSDAAAERRYWEVAGFARVSCGGTHLKRTGEIGPISLKRRNIGKGKERIEVLLDAP